MGMGMEQVAAEMRRSCGVGARLFRNLVETNR